MSCWLHLAALTLHLVGMWIKVDTRYGGVHRNWMTVIGTKRDILVWKRTRKLMQVLLITDFPNALPE